MKTVLRVIACLFFLAMPLAAEAGAGKACKATSASMLAVLTRSMKTLYNVFPIRLAGVQIMTFGELEDFNLIGNFPICGCIMPPPVYYRVGMPFSMWEPAHVVEIVQHPWCSPSLGSSIPIPINEKALGTQSSYATDNAQHVAAQAHLISYPVWNIIGMFVDTACFQFAKGFDLTYMTELDPLWQNDMWATLLGPEAVLVANPIAQLACAVDSVAATLGFPLDPLFWCMGAWGSTYPMSENMTSVDYVQAQAALAARLASKMHRELVLWGTMGPPTITGVCQRYPAPIWLKSQYAPLMLYPVPGVYRIPVGRTGLLWTAMKDYPFSGDDFVFMLYNKRDCCIF